MAITFKRLMVKKIEDYLHIIDSSSLSDIEKELSKVGWAENIKLMEFLTRRHFIRFNILNITTIIGGILIPVVVIFTPSENHLIDWNKTVAAILGILVSISSGINQSYKFNDKWKHFRKISESLKIEGESFFSLSGIYSTFDTHSGEAFKLFMSNVSKIKSNQIIDYMKKIADIRGKNQEVNEHTEEKQ